MFDALALQIPPQKVFGYPKPTPNTFFESNWSRKNIDTHPDHQDRTQSLRGDAWFGAETKTRLSGRPLAFAGPGALCAVHFRELLGPGSASHPGRAAGQLVRAYWCVRSVHNTLRHGLIVGGSLGLLLLHRGECVCARIIDFINVRVFMEMYMGPLLNQQRGHKVIHSSQPLLVPFRVLSGRLE